MVTVTSRMSHKPGQRRCPKLMSTALASDYLTADVILASAPTINTAV